MHDHRQRTMIRWSGICTGSLHIGTEIGTEQKPRDRERAKFSGEYSRIFLVLFRGDDRVNVYGGTPKTGREKKNNEFESVVLRFPRRILSRWYLEFCVIAVLFRRRWSVCVDRRCTCSLKLSQTKTRLRHVLLQHGEEKRKNKAELIVIEKSSFSSSRSPSK